MSIKCDYLVIGTGSIAKRHIGNLKKNFKEKIIGQTSGTDRKIKDKFDDVDVFYNSISDAIRDKPRFAIIASPASYHLENAKECLNEDVPVIIEKPLSDNYESYNKDKDFLLKKSNLIQIGYCLRYLPAAGLFREIVRSDSLEIGEALSVICEVGEYLPNWRPNRDYRTSVSAQKSLGGGALLELSHEIDYLNWIFGNFHKVFCSSRNSGVLEIDVEDIADVLLLSENGLVVNIHLDFLQYSPTRKCKLICREGVVIWDILENSIIMIDSDSKEELIYHDQSYDFNEMYLSMLNDVNNSIEKNSRSRACSIKDAAEVLSIISSSKESSRLENIVNLY